MRPTTRLLTAFALLSAASTAAAFAMVIYVNAAATPPGTGGSWATAFTSLQSGLTAAGSGDEIWVAAGTYRPTSTTDRTVSFAMKNGVGIYGGFNGTETQRTQRDPVVNVTVLSGDIGAPGIANDNSFHVVIADASVTATGILDGFTVTAGQADGPSNNDRGGGMWDNGGAPTIARILFTGNFALERGGGLRVTTGSPTLLNCSFTFNSVPSGVGSGGGGLYSGGGSTLYAQNCIFRSNAISGGSVGGAGLEVGGNGTLVNCVVAQNNPSGAHFTGDNNVIDDCTFANNAAYGAAFFVSNNNTLANSIVWGNGVGQIFNDGSSTVSAAYCDVQGGFAGAGNINANPLFQSAPTDLRLGPGSPAVDAGKNVLVPGGVILDAAGLPRFFDDPAAPDTGVGIPPLVDMGAYERVPLSVSDPTDQTVCSGAPAAFSVTASGQPPLSYQWRKNGVDLLDGGSISGATTAALSINPAAGGDAGSYDVVVTDGLTQTITSAAATLTVNATPTASASGSATICSGTSTPLTGSGGISCSWLPTTGLSNPASCNPSASPAATTTYTLTVTAASGCSSNNDPTVTVTVTPTPVLPTITAPLSVPVGASGATASVANHLGSTYAWTLTGGVITGGQTTYQIAFDAGPAGTTMHCSVVETTNGCSSPMAQRNIQVDFFDMPPSNGYHDYVNTVARNGITAGCGNGNYCGVANIKRSEMAVFLLKAKYGSTHVPPPATGTVFNDVHVGDFAADWIEEIASLGITGGCGGGNYCPNDPVTRAQMAVLLLKTYLGTGYTPPPPAGIFADVPIGSFADAWIEDLYGRGITVGCNVNPPLRYCPDAPNARQEMAVFVTRTFNLQ